MNPNNSGVFRLTRLSHRGTALVLSARMCVLMTMTARNVDIVISAMFMQKYVPESRTHRDDEPFSMSDSIKLNQIS